MTAFSEDGLSILATKLGTPLMLESYTSDLCTQSWGRSSYARAMIELRADEELKDTIMAAMPKLVGEGFNMCTIHVDYEWKPQVFELQANRGVSVGPKEAVTEGSFYEQWKKMKRDDDYDPYDDDMYDSHDMSDNLQTICDELDITVRGAIYRTEVCTEVCADIRRKTSREYTNYLLSAEDIYRVEGMTEGMKQNRNKLKSSSRDKEVNMTARYFDDVLVCYVVNTVEDHIIDSGASFHATYCKEELKGVSDVVLKTYFGTSWTLKDVREAEESFLHNVSEDKETTEVGATGVAVGIMQTFRAESMGIRVEASKMLWADSVSTTYLIYRIPYVPIGLRIPEEEWRGKDTSLTHLKVFGCDSFVKVKDVCGEAMKCTFIGSGSDEVRYSFQDTKSHQVIRSRDITFVDSIYGARSATNISSLTKLIQKSQVVLIDIPDNLAENDSIVAEHGLSSEITQSLGESSDTSEGFENNGSFEDSGTSDEEYSKDRASSKEAGSETPQNGKPESYLEALSSNESVQWKKAIIEEMVSLKKNQTCSLVRLPARKNASQSLWMFMVKEEHDGSKSCEDDYNQLAGQEENLECRLKEIMYGLIQAPRLWYLKFDSFMQKDKVGDEREVEVLRSFNRPPSKLITDDGVLPQRGYSQFNDVSSGYLVSKVS
ncbi:retrovirus-related pol polyprotein from transposon TNT 1-94 [Tanacetum coccineum]